MDRYNTCHQCQGEILLKWDSARKDWYELCPACASYRLLPAVVVDEEGNLGLKGFNKYLWKRQEELPLGM